jgi:ketosteroid isomerase-like protein
MSQENVEKAHDFLAAFNRGDYDAAMENFDPQIEWVLPEQQSSDSGSGLGHVRRFWAGLEEIWDELRLEPQESVDAGDRVATRLRFFGKGKGSGIELEEELYHQVATFDGGTIVRMEYFAEWNEALAAARARPESAPSASQASKNVRPVR